MDIPEEVIRAASQLVGRELWNGNPSPHEVEVVTLAAPLIADYVAALGEAH